jgi:hypothetical protein
MNVWKKKEWASEPVKHFVTKTRHMNMSNTLAQETGVNALATHAMATVANSKVKTAGSKQQGQNSKMAALCLFNVD